MSHIAKIALLAALATSLAAVAVPGEAFARTCNISGIERKLGPTYVTSLSVRGSTCRGARDLVKSFHRCRYASGGRKGRCRRRVAGFSCSERRFTGSRVQYDARVTCKKGTKRVNHVYTQNT